MSLNSVSISGRLTGDPEIHNFGQNSVANMQVACDRNFFNQKHQIDTDFFTVEDWRDTNFLKYFHKGDGIIVHGQLQQDHFTDRQGQNRTAVIIHADQIASAGHSHGNGGNGGRPGGPNGFNGPRYNNPGNVQRPMNNGPMPNNQPQRPQGNPQGNQPNGPQPDSGNPNTGSNVDPFAKPNDNGGPQPNNGNKRLDISKDDLPF